MEKPENDYVADDDQAERLHILHLNIDACQVCANGVAGFRKVTGVKRGDAGKIMVVGEGPGNKERALGRAFAGQSGKRLDAWLLSCGASHQNPRAGVYQTSVTKCIAADAKGIAIMTIACRQWLALQIEILKPVLIITLGKTAYNELTMVEATYEQALCTLQRSVDVNLFPHIQYSPNLIPWPHPSGLNRWLNKPSNMLRLEQSFDVVRSFLGKGESR